MNFNAPLVAMKRTSACTVLATCLLASQSALAQLAPPAKVCAASDKWFQCAEKVRKAIEATKDLKIALAAASEWSDRYDALYKANAQSAWPWSDQEMLRMTIEKLYDEGLGKYFDTASLAFGMALAKYLPRLAATLEFAGGAAVTGFVVLIAPSPIANDFTAAGPDNKRINALLMSKMPPPTLTTIQERYPQLFNKAYTAVRASKQVTKP